MENLYRIERFALGDWQTNCYLIYRDGRPATLVDAGFDPATLLDRIAALDVALEQVVLTHAHVDHIAGLDEVRFRHPDARLAVHEAEATFLGDPELNLSSYLVDPVTVANADATLAHGDTIQMGGTAWQLRHTPGHSPGGVTFYEPQQGVAIVGDTLFAQAVGRSDFPTSNTDTLMRSIREQLLTLPDETRVLPGHGPETTVGQERATNSYLR